jgi:hypothetical protein
MHILLRLFVGVMGDGDIEVLLRRRRAVLADVADNFRRFEPFFEDEALVFSCLDPAQRIAIEEYCNAQSAPFSFAAFPKYSKREIEQARFLPFIVKHEEIDCDKSGRALNDYPVRLCNTCWAFDLTAPPELFLVEHPTRHASVFNASNGVRILSASLWEELKVDIAPWVRSGRVAYADAPDEPVSDLLWIMPIKMIGPYINTVVVRTCPACGAPVEVRRPPADDSLLRNLDVVTEIPLADAPIGLVGSWYGEFRNGKRPGVSWDIVVSPRLHARLRALKPSGFGAAKRIVHTRQELRELALQR